MDKALKQRLVGAIVLIALAVIVLPMIFGGRPASEGSGPTDIELPTAPPDLEFETRRFPVGDQPPPQPGSSSEEQSEQEDVQPESANPPPLPQPRSLPESSQATAETVEPDTDTTAETLPSGVEPPPQAQPEEVEITVATPQQTAQVPASSLRYVVQVASFGSLQNATRLASQLENQGYAVLLDNVSSDAAQLNRVRVGPYASEAAAQTVVRALRDSLDGINPRIVDLQPDQASPAIASDDPMVRWVVQVGSFSSAENASNLVARLRLAGHSSYDETVTTSASTIFRVRVGPFLDRNEALKVEQQIRADMGIEGVVMSPD